MSKSQEIISRGMVIFSVSFYIVTALIMVFVNKWVLNSVSLPFTLLWFQVIMAVILLHFSSIFGILQLPILDKEKCIGLLPLIAINVLGLSFNTICLQYVDASFYQVARALVLPFTVLFSFMFLSQKTSYKILLACFVVCIGFFVGVSSERLSISLIGIIFGICSSISTALHAIVIKKSLTVVKGNTIELVYYNNVLSAIAFLPLIFLFREQNQYSELLQNSTRGESRTFLIGILITGFFGFLINVAGFLQIKVTSPVTHMISSAFRGVVQTILGNFIFGDLLTTGRVGGIFLILFERGDSFDNRKDVNSDERDEKA
ncbi:19209_t:CDS:2 [Funneliformis geosporum]|uniref:16671_t:CDS:1 n=1 Tax=Funneliformis geosporum TaxID=1117311 RepID=A0A9W4WSJ5_9GLOM|nr:16671_t:CDS:2 [Funneliformis geosporum]CAI2172651.1 19209_t:CDS:2 [Funneliformis geosporum]